MLNNGLRCQNVLCDEYDYLLGNEAFEFIPSPHDVFDIWRGIDLKLALTLSEQIFDSREILLVK